MARADGDGHSPYVQTDVGGMASRLSWRTRRRIFERLLAIAQPTAATTVLDVGVTLDRRADSNFFEKLYPWPERLVAAGIEDAAFLEQEHPGVRFVRAEGQRLPFRDGQFDLVVCFAVIEHAGNRARQRELVHELCRVGHRCCLATPNRGYPVEFHSLLPLVHWLPPARFRAVLRRLGRGFWAEEDHLNLLDERDALALFPADVDVVTAHERLCGPISNLVFHTRRRAPA